MKQLLDNVKKEAEKIRMSDAEKVAMHARIFGVLSPFKSPQGEALRRSPYVPFSFSLRFVAASSLVLVLVGAGTASAAQDALPGDALYPVKISILEKAESALARSPAAKAQVHAKLAERRLAEAQSLSAQGRLDGQKGAQLEVSFAAHAAAAEALAQEVADAEPGVAAEVKVKLATAAFARGKVLVRLGERGESEDNKKHSRALSQKVLASAEAPSAQNETEAATAATTFASGRSAPGPEGEDTTGERAAAAVQEKAARYLAEAREKFEKMQSLDGKTVEKIEKELSKAGIAISFGSAALGAGSFAEAAEDFEDALKTSARLVVLLEAQEKFDGDFIEPILDEEERERERKESLPPIRILPPPRIPAR